MNIIERTLNDVTVLELKGNLALEGNKQFRQHVAATIDAGARKLILNLAGVPYMDSSGLGELISCYTSMQKLSGSVKLLHLNDRLHNLLVITKLSALLETFDSEAAAISSFAP
jgi:anti-sigma B factor antagonist